MIPPPANAAITAVVRDHWGRILAALVKTFGDFALAEDALQDAALAAMRTWGDTPPAAPDAWLITTAKRRALDRLRRDQTLARKTPEIAYFLQHQQPDPAKEEPIPDQRLEMLFTCCHSALDEKTQIALTLRTLGGLTAEEIADAFLDRPATMAQRLSRARTKIRVAGIPYAVPDAHALPARLSAVMRVIYLIYTQGHAARAGEALIRRGLTREAIRLAETLVLLAPDAPEPAGLLALLWLSDARSAGRTDAGGRMVPLETQDRSMWDHAQIAKADQILKSALIRKGIGPYQLQAAISALHAQSPTWDATDWPQIAALYALLLQVEPSPVVALNHAVAVSYAQSAAAGLALLTPLAEPLAQYSHYHAAKADVLLRDGQHIAAADCFQIAINLTENDVVRAFLRAKAARLRPH